MKRPLFLFSLTLLLAPIACKPSATPPQEGSATMQVTTHFGTPLIPEFSFALDSRSVHEILRSKASVKTAIGGTYISSIESIPANPNEQTESWFFYINGILSHVGSQVYLPHPGDRIWWDFHSWQEGDFAGAAVGSFPEPFLHGYFGKCPPTVLFHTPKATDAAREIQKNLLSCQVAQVELQPLALRELPDSQTQIPLVIGTWEELQKNTYISDLFSHLWQSNRSFSFPKEGGLIFSNATTQEVFAGKQGAVAIACRFGFGNEFPFWIVAGTDADSLLAIAEEFQKNRALEGKFGLGILDGETSSLPLPTRKQALTPALP